MCDSIPQEKLLGTEFNRTLKKIQMNNESKCKSALQEVLPQVIERMRKTDLLFDKMYKCNVYTGSYYDKLRIKDACEFDINMVLSIPTKPAFLKVMPSPIPHAVLHLEKPVEEMGLSEKEVFQMRKLLDSDRYVLPAKLLAWVQGLIDRAALTEIKTKGVKQIKVTASGPARTLLIVLNDRDETIISVDLVPVFRFPQKEWPKKVKNLREKHVNKTTPEKRNLYLVPKCYKPGLKQSPNEPPKGQRPRTFRMHFADIEQNVLQEYPDSRPVIKLLKLLRDAQGWSNLHSYFLKTLVLNEIARNPEKEWKKDDLVTNLLEMMDVLKKRLNKKSLPHFFFNTVNLFQYMSDLEMQNMKARLEIIKKSICLNPSKVKDYFVV